MPSIRAKLTLWYLGIVALVLIAFAVAIYLYLSRGLLDVIDTSLWHQAERIAQAVADPLAEEEHAGPEVPMLAPQFVSILDESGEVTDHLTDSEGREVPVSSAATARARTGWRPDYEEAEVPGLDPVRVITWPARDEEGDIFFVVVGQSLKDVRRAQWQMLRLMGISIPIVLLLASFGGLLLANRALTPVDRLTRAAARIGSGNLAERVEEMPGRDEIARLGATFNRMIARLEEAFERERRFTADASHELRTPLSILRGDIEVALRRERSAGEYRDILQSNLEEIERLERLADDLLTLARSDSGEIAIERGPVRLDELAAEAVRKAEPLAQPAGVILSLDANEPVEVVGDTGRLAQLLTNLLDNGIKYTPANGSVVLAVAKDGLDALITVTDTGRGVAPEALPHIFDRFYRRSEPGDSRVGGFGLGLAISKWVVEAHGGSINAESEPGKGTRFVARIPRDGRTQTDLLEG